MAEGLFMARGEKGDRGPQGAPGTVTISGAFSKLGYHANKTLSLSATNSDLRIPYKQSWRIESISIRDAAIGLNSFIAHFQNVTLRLTPGTINPTRYSAFLAYFYTGSYSSFGTTTTPGQTVSWSSIVLPFSMTGSQFYISPGFEVYNDSSSGSGTVTLTSSGSVTLYTH